MNYLVTFFFVLIFVERDSIYLPMIKSILFDASSGHIRLWMALSETEEKMSDKRERIIAFIWKEMSVYIIYMFLEKQEHSMLHLPPEGVI